MRPVLCAFALSLACAAKVASAAPAELLERGLAELNRGEFEAARATLLQATRTLRERRPLAKALLHLGLCQAILGEQPAARRSFAAALDQDPWLRVDPDRVKRPLVALFESVLASRRGELAVSADAPDAEVRLDGHRLGRTPYLGELPAGRYRLELRSADGALGYRGEVTVVAGRKTELRARLVSLRAPLATRGAGPLRRRSQRATLVLGVATLAVGAAALGVGIAAHAARSDFESTRNAYLAATDLAAVRNLEEELRASKQAAEARATATNVLLATSGALAISTAVCFLVTHLGNRRLERAQVTVLVGPRAGGGLLLGGSF